MMVIHESFQKLRCSKFVSCRCLFYICYLVSCTHLGFLRNPDLWCTPSWWRQLQCWLGIRIHDAARIPTRNFPDTAAYCIWTSRRQHMNSTNQFVWNFSGERVSDIVNHRYNWSRKKRSCDPFAFVCFAQTLFWTFVGFFSFSWFCFSFSESIEVKSFVRPTLPLFKSTNFSLNLCHKSWWISTKLEMPQQQHGTSVHDVYRPKRCSHIHGFGKFERISLNRRGWNAKTVLEDRQVKNGCRVHDACMLCHCS